MNLVIKQSYGKDYKTLINCDLKKKSSLIFKKKKKTHTSYNISSQESKNQKKENVELMQQLCKIGFQCFLFYYKSGLLNN